jgi:hypothetical protein
LNPIATKVIQAAGYAAAGVATKAVGSFYRIRDDRHAPGDVLHKTIVREASLMGVAGLFLMGIQLLFTGLIYKRMPKITPFMESVTRLALAVPAFAISEAVSRWFGPRDIWQASDRHGDDHYPASLRKVAPPLRGREEDDDDDDDKRIPTIRPVYPQPVFSHQILPSAPAYAGLSNPPSSSYYPHQTAFSFYA